MRTFRTLAAAALLATIATIGATAPASAAQVDLKASSWGWSSWGW